MASDELIEKAARALWDATENTYGEEDAVEWVHAVSIEKTAARNAARAVLAVVEAERGWEYRTAYGHDSAPHEVRLRRHPASDWEVVPDDE